MQNDKRPLYAKIAIARNQLPEMEDDTYFYAWLTDNFSTPEQPITSRKQLSFTQLVRAVDLLGRLGATYTTKPARQRPHARPDWIEIPATTPHAAMKRQICAIWRGLGYSLESLETRCKRQCKQPSILWVHDEQHLKALLTDLQKRERAANSKKQAANGEAV